MSSLASTPDMLSLLYEQHRFYTAELGRTHHVLSKLYKKIAKVEKVLAERERKERRLSRDARKKWQYSRVLTKRTITDLESQQANLHDALRQCNDLIASLEHAAAAYNSQMTARWAAHFSPLSPYAFSPFSPFSPVLAPYTPPVQHCLSDQSPTHGGNLSSFPDRQASVSPYGSRSADSGFHEPHMSALGTVADADADVERLNDKQHAYAQRMMSSFAFNFNNNTENNKNNNNSPAAVASATVTTTDNELDLVPDLQQVFLSPTTNFSPLNHSVPHSHKRCLSANAVQAQQLWPLTCAPLAPRPPLLAKRGTSLGPVADRRQ